MVERRKALRRRETVYGALQHSEESVGRSRRQRETSNASPRRERTSATTARDLNCASITRVDKRDDRQREISTAPPRREGSDERDDSDSNYIDKKIQWVSIATMTSLRVKRQREGQVHWLNDASQAFTAA